MNSTALPTLNVRSLVLTFTLVQIQTFWEVSMSANGHWVSQDFIPSIFRVKFTTETLKIGTEILPVRPVTISSLKRRCITNNANVRLIWLWNCREQDSLSTVLHLRDVKERSQDSVVLKNASRPLPRGLRSPDTADTHAFLTKWCFLRWTTTL